jgi:hypothetical protein
VRGTRYVDFTIRDGHAATVVVVPVKFTVIWRRICSGRGA